MRYSLANLLLLYFLENLNQNVTAVPVAQEIGVFPANILKMTAIQMTAIFFSSGLILATILLGVQYLVRYRKYHVAQGEDQDSLADPSGKIALVCIPNLAKSLSSFLHSSFTAKIYFRIETRNENLCLLFT